MFSSVSPRIALEAQQKKTMVDMERVAPRFKDLE
jgi:hypothetical protein